MVSLSGKGLGSLVKMRRLIFATLALGWALGATAQTTEPSVKITALPTAIAPDATPITRSDLDRALASIQVHFDAIEKAVELSHQDAVRVPTLVDRAISNLQTLLESKIANAQEIVGGRVDKLEIQFQERTAAGSTAVAAALQAAKEAVGQQQLASASSVEKAQAQSGEALAQLRASFVQTTNAQEAQLSDVKSRLDRLDGPITQTQGSLASVEAQLADMKSRLDKADGNGAGVGSTFGWIIGSAGVVIALAALVLSVGSTRRQPASNRQRG